jgi:hypothetical protein
VAKIRVTDEVGLRCRLVDKPRLTPRSVAPTKPTSSGASLHTAQAQMRLIIVSEMGTGRMRFMANVPVAAIQQSESVDTAGTWRAKSGSRLRYGLHTAHSDNGVDVIS